MRPFLILIAILLLLPFRAADAEVKEIGPGTILAVRAADAVNPVMAEFIAGQISRANAENARAFLLMLDTPGGLDTAMRRIIQQILGSRVPVIVYIHPPGARAASAGALILLAADFAVMAPGTNAGAAHPVAIGFGGGDEKGKDSVMTTKVVQDASAYARSIARQRGRNEQWADRIVRESVSTPAREALDLKVIDFIAEDEAELLQKLDGRTFLRKGGKVPLETDGVKLVFAEMTLRQKILNVVSNPNVAYLLMMLGILGIFFEISQPGVVLPGAIGAIALLLAFFGLQTLPVNFAGVLLILLAIVLFILEIKVMSYGMLTIGGLVAMTLGSLMLIDSGDSPYMQISRSIIAGTVFASAALVSLVVFFVTRTQRTRVVSGLEGMIGERGSAVTDVHQGGRVFVHGEYWDAWSREPVAKGEAVEIVQVENLKVEVRRIP
jgi:membrane-bound serine protease (ClpP class)